MSEGPRLQPQKGLDLSVQHQGFAYQLDAVEAVRNLEYAALFHEQGLGKTKIGIDLALEWLREDAVDCVLFVTKRSLVQNWIEELGSHARIAPAVLDQQHSANFYVLNGASRLLLAHYEVLKSEERRIAMFLRTRRVGAILDESHKIKNPGADLSAAFHRLSAGFAKRVIMSGTPVANRPYDIWSQIKFLDGGKALGDDFEAFKADLELGNDLWRDEGKREAFEARLAAVFEMIRPFTVRETKSSAGLSLPDKLIENVPVELEAGQAELYRSYRELTRADVMAGGSVVDDDAEAILKRLLRLVQVASNPRLVDEGYEGTPAKLVALDQIIDEAVGSGSKAIVWTSFVKNAEAIARHLERHGAVVVHGGLGMDARNDAVLRFKRDDRARILVATPGAAKEGLTLTVANHAVFYDRSFSLDDYLQAQDRIHRISQTQTCHVWNLVAKGTVDEWVDRLLSAKRLAAQLAQSDIERSAYASEADYDFGRMVADILNGEEK
ncbi:MAG TPA: DEAD/DEAH box helicase [Sphingomicrobium sp.]